MRSKFLMLEDNDERLTRFAATLQKIEPTIELCTWQTAPAMIRDLPSSLPLARLISLDHDLEPLDGQTADPGTGWEVTQALVQYPAACPVIVHTSNGERGLWMRGELELEGWDHRFVAPVGDDWIETNWAIVVGELLVKKST